MAQSNMTRTVGLALEGGGYRGMYTAGVLDVWMEHGLRALQSAATGKRFLGAIVLLTVRA